VKERPVVVVIEARPHPHEVMLTMISGVYAVAWLTGIPLPASLSATAHAAVVGFFALGGLGFVAGVVALLLRRRPPVGRALKFEQGANLLIAAAGLLYVYAIVTLTGLAGWLVILLITFVWIAGSVWRAGQLLADLRTIKKEAR